jgi:hypothetical protein
MLFLQVNDAAVRIGLVIFGSKVQLFYTHTTETDWRGDLLGWLTVIWSGAQTDSLGEMSLKIPGELVRDN